jgi:hypothetical protein
MAYERIIGGEHNENSIKKPSKGERKRDKYLLNAIDKVHGAVREDQKLYPEQLASMLVLLLYNRIFVRGFDYKTILPEIERKERGS